MFFLSAFAQSLGLSLQQQRVGFFFGVALLVVGLVFAVRSHRAEATARARGDGQQYVTSHYQYGGITAQTVNVDSATPAARIEEQRRGSLLTRLHQEWLASHDGITPAMLAGTAALPKAWVEKRLAELGESWRQPEYRPGQALIPEESDGATT